jgi:hypothetical protein
VADDDLANLPLNCPRCGQPMRYLHARAADDPSARSQAAAAPAVFVYHCFDHGPFHVGHNTPLRPGR